MFSVGDYVFNVILLCIQIFVNLFYNFIIELKHYLIKFSLLQTITLKIQKYTHYFYWYLLEIIFKNIIRILARYFTVSFNLTVPITNLKKL